MSSDQISPQARRWLDTISYAEGTWTDQGPLYNKTYAYKNIDDLSKHPDRAVSSNGITSTAAGAYQFLTPTWTGVQTSLGLPDFGPQSQDLAALELIRRRGVDPDKDPITPNTVALLSKEWASLPTIEGKSAYGQPVKTYEELANCARSRGANPSAPTSSGSEKSPTPEQQTAAQNLFGALQLFTNMIRGGGDDELDIPEPKEVSPAQMISDQEKDRQKLLTDMLLESAKAESKEEQAKKEIERDLMSYADQARKISGMRLAEAMESFGTPGSPI